MTCEKCREDLSALIDRALAPEAVQKLWGHLRVCSDCSLACAEICCVEAIVHSNPAPAAPNDLWDRVRAALPALSGRERAAPDRAAILTPEEAAAYLRITVAELMESLSDIPHFHVAGQVRFRSEALEEWTKAARERAVDAPHSKG
ncbi:MAG TPA: helix-turn-helix domain-containing protein, partial [Armatimonadota bacterium]|nr:helix-turn-helix domain-containing protein [Armatimonadota bacterium]